MNKARQAYGQDTSQEGRILAHAPLVKRIACHLLGRLPPQVQLDDLIQAGMVGLLEAARSYDPLQGASFETYAGIRIRGAMLDELRRGDWTPRSLHRKAREVAQVMQRLEQARGGRVSEKDVAAALGMELSEYQNLLQQLAGCHLLSLEEMEEGKEEGGPSKEALEAFCTEALQRALEALPERERLVLALYYNEELNFKEIGAVLGVSESRVCQIHSQALLRLRSRMEAWR